MTIPKPIKYNKEVIKPNQPFEVSEEHIEQLRKMGAHLIDDPAILADDLEDDDIIPVSHEALVERCEELGIEVGRKSDKTLLKLIKQAESEDE